MWYLIINENSERYFIKKRTKDTVCFIKENSNIIEEKFVEDLSRENFKIVGEAFENEFEKLENLMKLNRSNF